MVTKEEVVKLLEEVDHPKADIPRFSEMLIKLQGESQQVLEDWVASGRLRAEAFNIAGVTPLIIRAKVPNITDPGIILVFDMLVSAVKREWQLFLEASLSDSKKDKIYGGLGECMRAASKVIGKPNGAN